MKLDEAIRQARIAVDAPHPSGYISDSTFVSRAVLRQVLDELAAMSRGVAQPAATVTLADYVTLHDQFATAAMQAAITGLATKGETFKYDEMALLAYEQADAMLAARGTK